MGIIYVAVVHTDLVYGSERWLMSPHIRRNLEGLHHSVAHRLMGKKPQRGLYERWVYPLKVEVMKEVGLQAAYTYFPLHQNKFSQYITTRTILDLFLAAERNQGTRVYNRWWDQEGLELLGMRTVDQKAELE